MTTKPEKKIQALHEEADREWSNHRSQTDVQTGKMYSPAARKRLMDFSKNAIKRRKDLHESLATLSKHHEFIHAQWAWEDFLYYQNVWNRKNDQDKAYTETYAKKMEWERINEGGNIAVWRKKIAALFREFSVGYRLRIPEVVGPENAHRYTQAPRGTTPQASVSQQSKGGKWSLGGQE